jgi:hypothetical protein
MNENANEHDGLDKRLRSLEDRISALELMLAERTSSSAYFQNEIVETGSISEVSSTGSEEESLLESRIGRFGLSWMGIIVLLFGIIFFTEYLMSNGQGLFSALTGYLCAGGTFLLAGRLKKSNLNLSGKFSFGGQLILFYITLRLHFFSAVPIMSSEYLVLILMLLVAALQTFLALKHNSQAYGTMAVIFVLITAMVSDATHILLPLVVIASAGAFYLWRRKNWQALLITAIILSHLTFFNWLFGNPAMGHPLQMLSDPQYGYIYLFLIGGCFCLMPLFRDHEGTDDDFITWGVIINGVLFTLMLLPIALKYFSNDYVALFGIVTLCCLIYSTILKSTSDWNFASAFFALYGFMAMSISLYGMVGFPRVYLLLSVQSLVVVAMALWFRNKLMIIMNSMLFMSIFMVYILFSKTINGASFSIAIVSLVSARLINWKRERFEIKTEMIRNLYLIEGFVMTLFALYHAVPRQFITLSWTIAALLFFLLSFILKNVKYRYMAIGTMISAAAFLFIVDLARIGVIYRVLALLVLAVVSIGISIYYTNRTSKRAE